MFIVVHGQFFTLKDLDIFVFLHFWNHKLYFIKTALPFYADGSHWGASCLIWGHTAMPRVFRWKEQMNLYTHFHALTACAVPINQNTLNPSSLDSICLDCFDWSWFFLTS
jgi:hypothetical protein